MTDFFILVASPILATHWFTLMCCGSSGAALWVLGARLSRLTKPDRPIVSSLLRFIGTWAKNLGLVATLSGFAWVLFISLILFAHKLLNGESFVEAVINTRVLIWENFHKKIISFIVGVAASAGLSWLIILRVITPWERGGGLPDVEASANKFKRLNRYDPRGYIDLKKGCFVGKDEKHKRIYIPWAKLRETHIQVLGTTGCGKGVAMSLMAYQCVLAGEAVLWIDPKFDRFSPRILQDAAKKAGVPFYLINLNPPHGPQINPLVGADAFCIEELFVTGFDLRGKGTDGDYHRGKDEDAAAEAARLAVETGELSIPGLFKTCASVSSITDQDNFWRKFKKLARLPAVNTKYGLNLETAISERAVIYIVGSSDSEPIKMLQKLLLVRINQIIKRRDRFANPFPICIVLDEFKHILSQNALVALGVVRDFDTHFVLAHQSNGDLRSCPGVDPEEARGAVVDNTAIKIIYKIGDDEYAEKISRVSGKRRTYVDSTDKNLDENGALGGSWKEANVQHIDMDVVTHLPMPSDRYKQASVGVLVGMGNSKLFHVGPVPVPKTSPMPVPVIVDAYSSDPSVVTELI